LISQTILHFLKGVENQDFILLDNKAFISWTRYIFQFPQSLICFVRKLLARGYKMKKAIGILVLLALSVLVLAAVPAATASGAGGGGE
jgi:predicted small secreted protein